MDLRGTDDALAARDFAEQEKKRRIAKAVRKLNKIAKSGDTEAGHHEADTVLCQLLSELGYAEVVERWQAVEKWYA